MHVIDLFCGCGGFSEGARQAGANVILAIDAWQGALDVHKANHPDTIHICESLGGDVHEFSEFLIGFIDLHVPKRASLHVHASPPCQSLSGANAIRNEDLGMTLVNWYLELTGILQLQLKDMEFTWSMEQVPNKKICELIDVHGGVKVDMSNFGIPQTRRRVFLGTL
ncbi:unnamed protein product, partial [Phaeothamnion confervicola]